MPNRVISVDLDKIRRLAKEHDIKICELERDAGLKHGTIRTWNKVVPNLKSLFGVAEVLRIDYWKLVEIKKANEGDN